MDQDHDWDWNQKRARFHRKRLGEAKTRRLAACQNYACVGVVCQGKKLLPGDAWEVDHVVPLWQGGSNELRFHADNTVTGNLQVLCALCHKKKTCRERRLFYASRRARAQGPVVSKGTSSSRKRRFNTLLEWEKAEWFRERCLSRFSSTQKRMVAASQSYRCVGPRCQGRKFLPPGAWEWSFVKPLWKGGGHTLKFDAQGQAESHNVCVLCDFCHQRKLQREKADFLNAQLKKKYGSQSFVVSRLAEFALPQPRAEPQRVRRRREFLGQSA